MKPEFVDIVMINMSRYSDWQAGVENRNFHVLHTLLNDPVVRKVVAVDYPPFSWRRALKQWWQDVVVGQVGGRVMSRSWGDRMVAVRESEIEKTGYSLSGFSSSDITFKLFVYSSVFNIWSEKLFLKRLNKQLDRLSLKNVVLWSYTPTLTSVFGQLKESCSVFDAVDNWLEHSAYRNLVNKLKVNYQIIRYKADLIFTTSPALVEFFDRARGCRFVPNGVNLEHLNKPAKLVGRDILDLPKPIIGYVGVIQEDRIDISLIEQLAKDQPNRSFVFIGPVWSSLKQVIKDRLLVLPNIYFLGYKSSQELPAYLKQFDVAIIPHLVNDFTRSTNPMKVYEYLAVGKPVVATPAAGLELFSQEVYLAATPADFGAAINKALLENSPAEVSRRQAVVADHTWRKRVEVMLADIINYLSAEVLNG